MGTCLLPMKEIGTFFHVSKPGGKVLSGFKNGTLTFLQNCLQLYHILTETTSLAAKLRYGSAEKILLSGRRAEIKASCR